MIKPYTAVGLIPAIRGIRTRKDIMINIEHQTHLVKAATWLSALDIPVRLIIDKQGNVKHIHFLSAFPEQEKVISEALKQWKFKPYEREGQRLEVETGIMFGGPSHRPGAGTVTAAKQSD